MATNAGLARRPGSTNEKRARGRAGAAGGRRREGREQGIITRETIREQGGGRGGSRAGGREDRLTTQLALHHCQL